MVEHKLNDKFALQGEVLYAPLGGKTSESGLNYTSKDDIKLGTLLIPVGVKYFITNSFAVGAGLNFGFIVSAKDKYEESYTYEGETENNSSEEDIKKYTNSLNFAPYIGAEYSLKNNLFFDARYNFGASNLAKESDSKLTNSFFQIGVGYKF